jgi:hypothetical protein
VDKEDIILLPVDSGLSINTSFGFQNLPTKKSNKQVASEGMAADTEWWYKNKDGEKTGASTGSKWCGG